MIFANTFNEAAEPRTSVRRGGCWMRWPVRQDREIRLSCGFGHRLFKPSHSHEIFGCVHIKPLRADQKAQTALLNRSDGVPQRIRRGPTDTGKDTGDDLATADAVISSVQGGAKPHIGIAVQQPSDVL